ncbi:MAG: PIN domain-containing protein [Snowella sp.]|nr:PIN domain-containing protein [Snowella sp.]
MIIVDTGFWLALANKNDSLHPLAKKQFQKLINQQFITTWCVVTETCYLLQKRVGVDAPKVFIHKISTGKLLVFDLKIKHCQRIEVLMEKYKDLPMDLADASLVILAEELGSGQILVIVQGDKR